jgi:2,3-dihydroxybenzoate decarboxylase
MPAMKIALEEHFMAPGFVEYWEGTVADVPRSARETLLSRLSDFGDARLDAMDKAGIARAALSLTGPGVQIEPDRATAVRKAAQANDFLAEQVQKRPDRFIGFAHLAMQDPTAAASELERCVKQLGFKAAMINGQTLGRYLDDRAYDPFWEAAQDLGAPIYIHPADPVRQPGSFADYKELTRATWGWTVETASHALRLIFGGVFDRFPGATLILGHMGETLPYLLWRLDSRAKLYDAKLNREPSDYIRDNIAITISGVYSQEPFDCALRALGADRVMFAADYPFESSQAAASFIDEAAIDETVREAVCTGNAKRILRLE